MTSATVSAGLESLLANLLLGLSQSSSTTDPGKPETTETSPGFPEVLGDIASSDDQPALAGSSRKASGDTLEKRKERAAIAAFPVLPIAWDIPPATLTKLTELEKSPSITGPDTDGAPARAAILSELNAQTGKSELVPEPAAAGSTNPEHVSLPAVSSPVPSTALTGHLAFEANLIPLRKEIAAREIAANVEQRGAPAFQEETASAAPAPASAARSVGSANATAAPAGVKNESIPPASEPAGSPKDSPAADGATSPHPEASTKTKPEKHAAEPELPEPQSEQARVTPQTSHTSMPSHLSGEPNGPRLEEAPAAQSIERAGKPQSIAEPEPLKNSTPARDIKLEVQGGNHRVELRLTERAGEVRVAVRTPDARLAGELRENLPSLSSRLEQAGFRTESLHAAPAPLGGVRCLEEASATGQNSSEHHAPQQQPDRHSDPESHQSKSQEESPNRKQKGKEFEWLMSSLR